jgi:hypothetical protein
VERPEPA